MEEVIDVQQQQPQAQLSPLRGSQYTSESLLDAVPRTRTHERERVDTSLKNESMVLNSLELTLRNRKKSTEYSEQAQLTTDEVDTLMQIVSGARVSAKQWLTHEFMRNLQQQSDLCAEGVAFVQRHYCERELPLLRQSVLSPSAFQDNS